MTRDWIVSFHSFHISLSFYFSSFLLLQYLQTKSSWFLSPSSASLTCCIFSCLFIRFLFLSSSGTLRLLFFLFHYFSLEKMKRKRKERSKSKKLLMKRVSRIFVSTSCVIIIFLNVSTFPSSLSFFFLFFLLFSFLPFFSHSFPLMRAKLKKGGKEKKMMSRVDEEKEQLLFFLSFLSLRFFFLSLSSRVIK